MLFFIRRVSKGVRRDDLDMIPWVFVLAPLSTRLLVRDQRGITGSASRIAFSGVLESHRAGFSQSCSRYL